MMFILSKNSLEGNYSNVSFLSKYRIDVPPVYMQDNSKGCGKNTLQLPFIFEKKLKRERGGRKRNVFFKRTRRRDKNHPFSECLMNSQLFFFLQIRIYLL